MLVFFFVVSFKESSGEGYGVGYDAVWVFWGFDISLRLVSLCMMNARLICRRDFANIATLYGVYVFKLWGLELEVPYLTYRVSNRPKGNTKKSHRQSSYTRDKIYLYLDTIFKLRVGTKYLRLC